MYEKQTKLVRNLLWGCIGGNTYLLLVKTNQKKGRKLTLKNNSNNNNVYPSLG